MKQQRIPLLRTLTFIAASLAAASVAAQAVAPGALPTGGKVVAGLAQIQQSAGRMDIRQDSQKVILNWDSFNIGSQAQVVFSQPNSGAIALNRVITSDPSGIFGRLNANGQVFLINPNGIIFGAGSSVNVGGLVAATLNIKEGEFLNGNYRFTRDGAAGSIENQGSLTAADQGYIALLAPKVRNQGALAARYGTVALVAGDAVTLGFQNDGAPQLLSVQVDPATVNAQVENQQVIRAEGGNVLFSAKVVDGFIGQAINNGAVIEATTLYRDGAKVMLDGMAESIVLPTPAIPKDGTTPVPGGTQPAPGGAQPPPDGTQPAGGTQATPPTTTITQPKQCGTPPVAGCTPSELSVATPSPTPPTQKPPPGIGDAQQPGGQPGKQPPVVPLPISVVPLPDAGKAVQHVLKGINVNPPPPNPPPPVKNPPLDGGPAPGGNAPSGGKTVPGVEPTVAFPILPQTKPVLTMAMPAAPAAGQVGGVVPQSQSQQGISQYQPSVIQQQPQQGTSFNQPLAQSNVPQQQSQPNTPNQPVAQDGKPLPLQPVKVAQKDTPDKPQESKNVSGEGTSPSSQTKAEVKADNAPDKGEKSEKPAKTDVGRAAKAAASGRFARLMAADTLRHQMRTELYKDALNVLQQNPAAADVPACGAGAGTLCVPAPVDVPKAGEAAVSTSAQGVVARIAGQDINLLPSTPIRRKVAYLIGNNDYKGAIPALETPIGDVEAIAGQLNQKLGYEVNIVKNASKADIILTLKKAAESATQDESVLIMYAGHGYQMDSTKQGYWIPTDASNTTPEKWVSNSDITKFMSAIPAKQVILISDSCFSGSLAKEQKMVATGGKKGEILSRRSVLVMSSGGEEPVSDEGKDGHSIFAYTLINQLKKVSDFSTSSQVFENVKIEVSQEYPQEPQLGMVTSAGHTVGGDYLFEINQVIKGGLK